MALVKEKRETKEEKKVVKKGGLLKDSTYKTARINLDETDVKNLGLDWETSTNRSVREFVIEKLNLPKRERTRGSGLYSKEKLSAEMQEKLGLPEDAKKSAVYAKMKELIEKK